MGIIWISICPNFNNWLEIYFLKKKGLLDINVFKTFYEKPQGFVEKLNKQIFM